MFEVECEVKNIKLLERESLYWDWNRDKTGSEVKVAA